MKKLLVIIPILFFTGCFAQKQPTQSPTPVTPIITPTKPPIVVVPIPTPAPVKPIIGNSPAISYADSAAKYDAIEYYYYLLSTGPTSKADSMQQVYSPLQNMWDDKRDSVLAVFTQQKMTNSAKLLKPQLEAKYHIKLQ